MVVSKTRFLIKQKIKHMDPITIIIATGCVASLVGLAFMSGHEYGKKAGITTERDLANRRVNSVLASENRRAPRTRRTRK